MVSEASKPKVLVGMSGGVDSSVAAALLVQQGYEVIGAFLKLWEDELWQQRQSAQQEAAAVAQQIGISFYTFDVSKEFYQRIVQYFGEEYRRGRTPNPCARCNQQIKFGFLLERARELGASYVATGHYVRVEQDPHTRRWILRSGLDPERDQSYFLFLLNQDQLAHACFPLGEKTKEEVRTLAQKMGLIGAERKRSVEVCFVPEGDYRKFLIEHGFVSPHRGEIVDLEGNVLGEHQGIEFFTIGQRRGLGIAASRPLYVVDLDPEKNRVVVAPAEQAVRRSFHVEQCNWIAISELTEPREVIVKIRYSHKGTSAKIFPEDRTGWIRVELSEPLRGITPGQAAVFYEGDRVLGGGWIVKEPFLE